MRSIRENILCSHKMSLNHLGLQTASSFPIHYRDVLEVDHKQCQRKEHLNSHVCYEVPESTPKQEDSQQLRLLKVLSFSYSFSLHILLLNIFLFLFSYQHQGHGFDSQEAHTLVMKVAFDKINKLLNECKSSIVSLNKHL